MVDGDLEGVVVEGGELLKERTVITTGLVKRVKSVKDRCMGSRNRNVVLMDRGEGRKRERERGVRRKTVDTYGVHASHDLICVPPFPLMTG